jgi:ubiquinone/menaquinone biosynthesis C-methylase UbiE
MFANGFSAVNVSCPRIPRRLTRFAVATTLGVVDLIRNHHGFDRWARSYDRSLLQPLLFTPTHLAALVAAVDAGAHPRVVLDLGCGTGRLLERAAETWPDARSIGVDAAPGMIAEAKRKHQGDPRLRFEVGDAAALPLDPSSIDLALSTISFHHWADQLGGVREVARVLRPGGLFVLADIRPPLLLRPILRGFHASRSRQRLFEKGGLTLVEQRRPLRLGGHVLITVGRRA